MPVPALDAAQERAWRERTLPPVQRLAGDVWSVPVPIPHNPLRYTLTYLLAADRGIAVVDPGWDSPAGWDALVAGLAAAGAAPADVVGIVATHVHPDHHGLSGRLREASGAWIAMHPAEVETLPHRQAARMAAAHPAQGTNGAVAWLAGVCGAPEDVVEEIMSGLIGGGDGRRIPAMAEPDVVVEDRELVPLPGRRLRALWTPGHTPGHLCLVDEDTRSVLTGDHVLPTISPNISAGPMGGDGVAPLAAYLQSLAAMAAYDDHDALPAHQFRFRGLAARVGELTEHHRLRCTEIVDTTARLGRPTMWELSERLTWSRPWGEIGPMRFAAVGETAAHVQYLAEHGALRWDGDAPARVRVPAA